MKRKRKRKRMRHAKFKCKCKRAKHRKGHLQQLEKETRGAG